MPAPPSGAGMVPPGYFAPAFPFMPMTPFQTMAPADNKGEGMKALECLMTLLVDEMRDMKRGLASLHQEFTDLRFVFLCLRVSSFPRSVWRARRSPSTITRVPLHCVAVMLRPTHCRLTQDKYSDLLVQLPKPAIAFKILEQRGVVPPVFIWANEPFLQMVDFTLAELVELPLLKLSMIDFKVTRQLRSLVREPGPSLVSEAAPISPLLVRRDGSMVRIVTRLQVYFGPNKRPKWAIIVVDNVEQDTRHKQPATLKRATSKVRRVEANNSQLRGQTSWQWMTASVISSRS
ncbi:uncharacterized protein ACA1_123880 [Acanthamoeba castellanii str. Neff]|uniref:Uncharacterized protein n=1 Tax=Acanthamoeba castellanii (strain ATCC 30010 / Neff) TaxID=1257118 RepID=L8HGM4_ACACF|nr:uncharacterized protein ACA1_123880 [Acanthamoeba castellanii str. Neff]ELR23868.1 hypothetical protein ACA1_123880 [Acanthamoeba castellanii str. Neff]